MNGGRTGQDTEHGTEDVTELDTRGSDAASSVMPAPRTTPAPGPAGADPSARDQRSAGDLRSAGDQRSAPRRGRHRPKLTATRLRDSLSLQVLGIWTLTRLAGLWLVAQSVWLIRDESPVPFLDRWDHWDVRVFRFIAEYGYDGPPSEPGHYGAFFPGFPLALKVVHVVVPNWVAAGLVLSFLAGAVAVVSLAHLVADEWGPVAGRRAVWALTLSPLTVFLSVGYSESLFLAFAFSAVLFARRGRWALAAVLAAGGSLTRVTGFFLALALAVEFAGRFLPPRWAGPAGRPRPRLRQVLWLGLAPLPGLGFFWYLHGRTGSWTTYFDLQSQGWGRRNVGVLTTFRTMWGDAFPDTVTSPAMTFGYRVELVAVALGLLLAVGLALARRWSEAVFVGFPLLLLLPMATYSSAARTGLTWWPLWLVLGVLSARQRWGPVLSGVYLAVAIPSAAMLFAAFAIYHWAG